MGHYSPRAARTVSDRGPLFTPICPDRVRSWATIHPDLTLDRSWWQVGPQCGALYDSRRSAQRTGDLVRLAQADELARHPAPEILSQNLTIPRVARPEDEQLEPIGARFERPRDLR